MGDDGQDDSVLFATLFDLSMGSRHYKLEGLSSTGWTLSLSKGREVGCEGAGDIGVRFDRLNELRDRKVSEFVGRSKSVLYVIPFFFMGDEGQDQAAVTFPSSYLRKQVSMSWTPAFAGMTIG